MANFLTVEDSLQLAAGFFNVLETMQIFLFMHLDHFDLKYNGTVPRNDSLENV